MFKILGRNKIGPIHLLAGDTLNLVHHEPGKPEQILATHSLDATQTMTVDEGVLFAKPHSRIAARSEGWLSSRPKPRLNDPS